MSVVLHAAVLLSAAQVDHWVVMYDCKEEEEEHTLLDGSDHTGGWDKSSWWSDMEMLQKEYNPLINLPFLIDCAEQRVLSQTNAILTHLGRELNMFGGGGAGLLTNHKWQACQCAELLCEIMDLRDLMVQYAYGDDDDDDHNKDESSEDEAATTTVGNKADAQQLLEDAKRHLARLEQHMRNEYPEADHRIIAVDDLDTIGFYRHGACHLVGGQFTASDFPLWEMLDQYQGLCSYWGLANCLGDTTTYSDQVDQLTTTSQALLPPTVESSKSTIFPYLKEFHTAFIHLPENQNYASMYHLIGAAKSQEDSIQLPYNNPYARFGSGPANQKYTRGQSGSSSSAGAAAPWRKLGEVKKSYTRIASADL